MIKTATLTAAALLAGLALAQGFGPPTARGPVAERAPARVEATRAAMRGRAIATQTTRATATAPAGRMQGSAGLGGSLQGVVASAIGLSEAEVHEQKLAGASLGAIAEAHGVDLASLEAVYLAAPNGLIAERLAAGAVTELQAERMAARGADAFASLIAREGCDEGRNVTGEPLHAQRVDAPRGPATDAAAPARRGPQARW